MQKIDGDMLTFDQFPQFPTNLYSESQCDLLIGVETALTWGAKRMQVLTESPLGNLALVFANLDRLVQHTEVSRILLLLSSPQYEQRVKYDLDALSPSPNFDLQMGLPLPNTGDAHVYVSTIRKVYAQVKRWKRETAPENGPFDLREMFDIVVVFDNLSGSLMWRAVLDAFDAITIAYSGTLEPDVVDMMGRCVVSTRYAKSAVERVLGGFLARGCVESPSTLNCMQHYQEASNNGASGGGRQAIFSLPCSAWRWGHSDTREFVQTYNMVGHGTNRCVSELTALVRLRDAALSLLDAERDLDRPDEDLIPLRRELNACYDDYLYV